MKIENFFITEAYAIKNVKYNLFSTGGTRPMLKEEGKFWKRIGDVKSHITQICDGSHCNYYKDCYIFKYKLQPDMTISEELICEIKI